MKQLALLVATLMISGLTFAGSSGFEKNASTIEALSQAWKTEQTMKAKEDKNDITIVYGGEDMYHKPTDSKTYIA